MSAAALSIVTDMKASWPPRPDPSVLSKSIPLFFISRDNDGFWIACEADFRIGGIFLFQRSALNFAKRCSEPKGCATMILEEPHQLEIENSGNRFVGRLRPAVRLVRDIASKMRFIGARLSRAYIEDRVLRAALEVELYRGRYKHSNKNDDDLPIVTETCTLTSEKKERPVTTVGKDAWPVVTAFSIFALIIAGIVALRVAIWLPAFQD